MASPLWCSRDLENIDQQQQLPLFNLPSEIRDETYHWLWIAHFCESKLISTIAVPSLQSFSIRLQLRQFEKGCFTSCALLLSCRKVVQEALPVAYDKAWLIISSSIKDSVLPDSELLSLFKNVKLNYNVALPTERLSRAIADLVSLYEKINPARQLDLVVSDHYGVCYWRERLGRPPLDDLRQKLQLLKSLRAISRVRLELDDCVRTAVVYGLSLLPVEIFESVVGGICFSYDTHLSVTGFDFASTTMDMMSSNFAECSSHPHPGFVNRCSQALPPDVRARYEQGSIRITEPQEKA